MKGLLELIKLQFIDEVQDLYGAGVLLAISMSTPVLVFLGLLFNFALASLDLRDLGRSLQCLHLYFFCSFLLK